jgi:hypothetical protein
MLSAVMLSVVMLNVAAPVERQVNAESSNTWLTLLNLNLGPVL